MKNRLLNIFSSFTGKVPAKIKNLLFSAFPEAKNVEWESREDGYEAVFYVNEVEHIARITEKDGLTGFKKNLKPEELPEAVSTECQKAGEIMNAIAIHTKNKILYEVIVRDHEFNRTLLLVSETGELLETNEI